MDEALLEKVADGRVFVFGADGLLRAISLETGRRLWGHDLHTEYQVPQGYFGAACSPNSWSSTLGSVQC